MTAGMKDAPLTTGVEEVAENVMNGLASGERIIWSPSLLRYVAIVFNHLPAKVWRKVADR